MWNILLTLIIIAALWLLGSNGFQHFNPVQDAKQVQQEKKTADKMTEQVQEQVNYARQMQTEETKSLGNN